MNEEMIQKPSFGAVTVTRTSGRLVLTGSEIVHQHAIRISIRECKMYETYGEHKFHPIGRGLVEFTMSEFQFAQMCSAIGVGEGIPCTLNRVMGEGRVQEEAPTKVIDPMVNISECIESGRASFSDSINVLNELLSNKKITRKAYNELTGVLNTGLRQFGSNTEFTLNMFEESVEKVKHRAKSELETYAQLVGFGGDVNILENKDAANEKEDA